MLLVGLTGGIASGKSSVAQRLVERGAALIDADLVAREVVEPGTPALKAIVERFGDGVLAADGALDRPALAEIAFADPRARADLEAITHPAVARELAARTEALAAFDGLVVLDIPLLVETGVERGYDAVVVVATYPETQLGRLVRDRRMDERDARARIDAQAPLEDKLARATHVVWNEGGIDALRRRVDVLADELEAMAAAKSA